jgi:hypothetical protein
METACWFTIRLFFMPDPCFLLQLQRRKPNSFHSVETGGWVFTVTAGAAV